MGNSIAIESREDAPPSPGSMSSSSSSSSYSVPPRERLLLQRKGSSFLEEPITSKHTERGEAPLINQAKNGSNSNSNTNSGKNSTENQKLRFAVSEMQGWRSHMEDKHNLCPYLSWTKTVNINGRDVSVQEPLTDHYLFAVFDGHGGNFTSHFAGENLVRTLTSRDEFKAYMLLPVTRGNSDSSTKTSKNGSNRINTPSESNTRGDVIGLKLLKAALISTFLELDAQLLQAQRHRRLDQLQELENIMSNLGTVVEQEVFRPGSNDHTSVREFQKIPPPSLPNNVQLERSGSTGVVVLVTPTHVICANAGDSRAMLSRSGMALPLSFDHKPNNDVEVARVEKAGGFVRAGRVDGDLAVSRSFGDFAYKSHSYLDAKSQRVSVCPDIVVHPRDYANDEYIVLACDGVWDRLTNRDCAALVRTLISDEGESDPGLVCEEIIDHCLELDSRDNMTCAVVVFPAAKMNEASTKTSLKSNVVTGVMKRRMDRERKWGWNSSPAKRAQGRLEERRKKSQQQFQKIVAGSNRSVSSGNKSVSTQRSNGSGKRGTRRAIKEESCAALKQ
mmetsp:Transcript_2554/g.4912  ORF Transcript_2554/g.4912 Transcript_2554/m.4912 type:complete len:560 (-) Transcript_2554:1774-3453(-)